VVGTIVDGGNTLDALTQHGFGEGTLDFLFLDHDMRQNEGRTWSTTEHKTHAEYQSLLADLVLESIFLFWRACGC
jgi:catechol O-methyltransferase